jgi:glucose-6-phosphate isomerase
MLAIEKLLSRFDPKSGELEAIAATQRHLSDLRGCFANSAAYEAALAAGDPLLYTVASVAPGDGPGDLHYAIGRLMPGRVGREYFMTKGHFHARREAAEFYFGLSGEGAMLLEDEPGNETRLLPLQPHHAVYVPGHTAHRTINTGEDPLIYLGVYPADAGHDYAAVAQRNFRKVVIERNGQPVLVARTEFLCG